MTKFRRIFYLFLAFIFLYGCSTVPNELKTAEQLIETAPDSALQMLRKLPPHKYKYAKNRALYGLLMIQAKNNLKLPIISDSTLDFSISYFQEHPSKDRLATCYFYRGRIYKYTFQYEKAMNYYLRANDELKNYKNNILLGRINFDIGDINNIQGEYAMARNRYMISYNYFTQARLQPQAFYSLLNIGRTYYESKNYRKASDYYRKIIKLANDSLQKGALYQEMGLNFYDSKRFDSALFYFRKIIKFPYLGNNRAIRYNLLSELYFNMKNIDSSYFYATNAFKFKPPVRTQRECYRIMTNCEFKRGHLDSITLYMNKYVALGDSIRKIDAQTKGSVLETMHISRQETEKAVNRFRYLFILLFVLISAVVIIYIRKHRLNQQEKLQAEKEAEQIRLHQKIEIRKHEIEKHLDILLKKRQEKKSTMASERKNAIISEKDTMDIEIYNELLHFNNIGLFYSEMDTLLNNIVTKLKTTYPNLNDKEITWCCLYLLRIPASDMYLMLDYTVNGLKKMRQRLALKMNVQGVSELYTLLYEMLYE